MTTDPSFKLAIAHHQAGQLVDAQQLLAKILAADPRHAGALHLMGTLARQAKDRALALHLLRTAVDAEPTNSEYQCSLGAELIQHRQFKEAAFHSAEAARLDPRSSAAHCNLGFALIELSQNQNAVYSFDRAIGSRPNLPAAHLGRSNALGNLGRLHDAIAGYRITISIAPEMVDAHIHLATLLCQTGEVQEGIQGYRAALDLNPQHFNALTLLGNTLMLRGSYDQAELTFRRVVHLHPQLAIGRVNLANLFYARGLLDEAQLEYEQAIALDGSLAAAHCNLGTVLKDRGQAERAVASLRRAVELDPSSAFMHSNLVYATCFCPGYDAGQLLDEARAWADRFEKPLLQFQRPHENDRDENRRLRIGYLSTDLRDHVVGRNVLPILQHHDHESFEIHCFSLVTPGDSTSAPFKTASDHWHKCGALSDQNLADEIRRQQIDILVDLSLHMQGNRLPVFARKPAPVQVTWAGYPGTTGLSSIDFRITDPFLDPPGMNDAFYSEQSIRLPNTFWCYRPPENAPEVNPLPAIKAGYVTFGCLNNFSKVTIAALDLWCEVLHAATEAKLIILSPTGSLRIETVNYFQKKGIDPTRIKFADRGEGYFRDYHRIDVCLDPVPYTGHSTTLDALWMGVPVVTLSGSTSVARGSVTALSNIGLTDLIAHAPAEYISIASQLANDLPGLTHMRGTLRTKMRSSPICDEARFTIDLENAYRKMWRLKRSV